MSDNMWRTVRNDHDILQLMHAVGSFHDSCIKEMYYVSGAYVNDDLSMCPVNTRRELHVIFQRQADAMPMLELAFADLKVLRLAPNDPEYTCEILDASLFRKDGCIWWCDDAVSPSDAETYTGTLICAGQLRFRPLSGPMGAQPFFEPITE